MAKKTPENPYQALDTEDRKKLLKEIQKARAPAALIADAFGVSRNTITFHCKKLGIELPNGSRMDRTTYEKVRDVLANTYSKKAA